MKAAVAESASGDTAAASDGMSGIEAERSKADTSEETALNLSTADEKPEAGS